jgi:aldehyde dehydrogenase (NAD+)
VDAKSGNTFEIRNPADDSLVASNIQVAGSEDIDDAVAAATAAFNGPWRSLTGAQRGDLLHKFADLLNDHLDQVSSLETGSMGIPISVSRMFASVAVSYFHCRSQLPWCPKMPWISFIDAPIQITPDTPTSWKGVLFPLMMAYTRLFQNEPLGVVASIASWNTTALYLANAQHQTCSLLSANQ